MHALSIMLEETANHKQYKQYCKCPRNKNERNGKKRDTLLSVFKKEP
jgi:hypothetical protein